MESMKKMIMMILIIAVAGAAIYMMSCKMMHKNDVKVQAVGADGVESGSDSKPWKQQQGEKLESNKS